MLLRSLWSPLIGEMVWDPFQWLLSNLELAGQSLGTLLGGTHSTTQQAASALGLSAVQHLCLPRSVPPPPGAVSVPPGWDELSTAAVWVTTGS